jgi:short-subunit dehydrogenase
VEIFFTAFQTFENGGGDMSNWLIIGAAGGIGTALAREMASRGNSLFLADREIQSEILKRNAQDIKLRYGSEVTTAVFEALEFEGYHSFISDVESKFSGKIYGVIWAAGVMLPNEELTQDHEKARKHLDINYTAPMLFLNKIAEIMEQRGTGHIVAIGSPAGDRGRKSNYIYGAEKSALHKYLEGLRHRFGGSKITVLTAKPGPTRTEMTTGMNKLPLLTNPENVAADIARAIDKRKSVVYTPIIWQPIMAVIRHLPEFVFRKLNI